MSSGIFAVATIGKYRLYVGETHQLKTRWAKIMAMFVQGEFPSKNKDIVGYRQFLKDTTSADE